MDCRRRIRELRLPRAGLAAAVSRPRAARPRPLPGAPVAAGFAGGFLGAATSLNGVAPVLLLARDKGAEVTSNTAEGITSIGEMR